MAVFNWNGVRNGLVARSSTGVEAGAARVGAGGEARGGAGAILGGLG